MILPQLQEHARNLDQRIGELKGQLTEIGGEEYKGCWLDSTKNRKGTPYRRLRWFVDGNTRKKGCRTLKPDEVARAERAIALWSEVERLERELVETEQQIREVESRIKQLAG